MEGGAGWGRAQGTAVGEHLWQHNSDVVEHVLDSSSLQQKAWLHGEGSAKLGLT